MKSFPLLVLLALLAQEPDQLPKEPIKDWKYWLKDVRHDPKSNLDVEEVTLQLEGEEAVPRLPVKKDKEIFDLKGIHARYFTTPTPKEPSREITVKGDRGTLDKGVRTLKLDGNVEVVRKGDPKLNEIDTVMKTSSALLHFNRMYTCPVCRKIFGALGHCPEHGAELRETTITSVESDREFVLTGPEGIISGTGLVTDDAIRRDYHIARDGFVEFSGDLAAAADRTGETTPRTRFTQIFSRGPLAITGPLDARTVHGEGGVRTDRIDESETLTLMSETLTIDTVRRWDLSPTGPVDSRKLDAQGDVVIDGVSFADGESFHATTDTLLRTKSDDDRDDVTVMTAKAPRVVSLIHGLSQIDSRKVTIRKAAEGGSGSSVFEDVVRSDLAQGDQHFNLACGTLVTLAGPNAQGKTELRTLDATGHVVLGGLMGKADAPSPDGPADPGEARADHFTRDMTTGRGLLESLKESPFVRITQGASTILAPKVLLESNDIMVLKGPKSVRLVQEANGKKEEYRATCDGDLIIDNSPEHHQLLMKNHCVLRTEEMLLNSDRITGDLAPGGKGLQSLLAVGHVRAIRESDHTMLHGDRLFYRFADQNLRIYGSPRTIADTGHSTSTQGEIHVYDQKHPKTGEVVRYTEMIGDSDGVRIEIEERAVPKADDRKK
jgi:hypothetical protein